jgi:hypothetical protein
VSGVRRAVALALGCVIAAGCAGRHAAPPPEHAVDAAATTSGFAIARRSVADPDLAFTEKLFYWHEPVVYDLQGIFHAPGGGHLPTAVDVWAFSSMSAAERIASQMRQYTVPRRPPFPGITTYQVGLVVVTAWPTTTAGARAVSTFIGRLRADGP